MLLLQGALRYPRVIPALGDPCKPQLGKGTSAPAQRITGSVWQCSDAQTGPHQTCACSRRSSCSESSQRWAALPSPGRECHRWTTGSLPGTGTEVSALPLAQRHTESKWDVGAKQNGLGLPTELPLQPWPSHPMLWPHPAAYLRIRWDPSRPARSGH